MYKLTGADNGFPICRFSKNFIHVLSATDIKNLNNFSDSIALHIMNTSSDSLCIMNARKISADEINDSFCAGKALSSDTSAIHLQIPIGAVPSAFVCNDAYKNFEMSVPDGWTVSQWKISSSGYVASCSISSAESQMTLAAYECISVKMGNIVSLCAPGATCVGISIENVAGCTKLTKIFHLLKKKTPLEILKFAAIDSVVQAGGKARLIWNTAEKTVGKIFPNAFDVTQGVSEYDEVLQKSKTYTLQIANTHESGVESCTVYVSPPRIQEFSLIDPSITAAWTTEYASAVAINGSACAGAGTMLFPAGTAKVTLHCDGYLYSTEKTLFLGAFQPLGLQCETFIFPAYTVVRARWNPAKTAGCSLLVQEPEDHAVCDVSKGVFEYAYLHPSKNPVSNDRLKISFVASDSTKTVLYASINWKEGTR